MYIVGGSLVFAVVLKGLRAYLAPTTLSPIRRNVANARQRGCSLPHLHAGGPFLACTWVVPSSPAREWSLPHLHVGGPFLTCTRVVPPHLHVGGPNRASPSPPLGLFQPCISFTILLQPATASWPLAMTWSGLRPRRQRRTSRNRSLFPAGSLLKWRPRHVNSMPSLSTHAP
jgi:hypothetical protein